MKSDAMSALDYRPSYYPWPFNADKEVFRWSVNVEQARSELVNAGGTWGKHILEVDDYYVDQIRLREEVIAKHPHRCDSDLAQAPVVWDAILFVLSELADTYPDHISFTREGRQCRYRNDLLGIEQDFVFGDAESLPSDPLYWMSCQITEDVNLLTEREDGHLYVSAATQTFNGTFPATFMIGSTFASAHAPVPRINQNGLVERTEQFLKSVSPAQPMRRRTWGVSKSARIDQGMESFPEWGQADQSDLIERGAYGEVRLRTEVQHLIKLPRTGALLFLVKAWLLPFAEIAAVPVWNTQMCALLSEMPEDIARYKGFADIRTELIAWMEQHQTR